MKTTGRGTSKSVASLPSKSVARPPKKHKKKDKGKKRFKTFDEKVFLQELRHKDWRIRCKALKYLKAFRGEKNYIKWVLSVIQEKKDEVSECAFDALRAQGPKVIPFLIPLTENVSVKVERRAMDSLHYFSSGTEQELMDLLRLLKHKNSSVRWRAIISLETWKHKSNKAFPYLLAIVGDKDLGERAIVAISNMNVAKSKVAPVLKKLLLHSNLSMQKVVIDALKKKGIAMNEVVVILTKAIRSGSPQKKLLAVRALGYVEPKAAAKAIPALLQTLASPSHLIQRASANSLLHAGFKLEKAVPVLIKSLKSKDENLQKSSAELLAKLRHTKRRAIPYLVRMLESKNASVRLQSIKTLITVGRAPAAELPLQKMTLEPSTQIKANAAEALGSVGSTKKTLSMLLKLLQHPELKVQAGAARGIEWFEGKVDKAFPLFLQILKRNNPVKNASVLCPIIRRIAFLKKPTTAFPIFRKLFLLKVQRGHYKAANRRRRRQREIEEAIVQTLERIGARDPRAISLLFSLYWRKDRISSIRIRECFMKMPRKVMPVLQQVLQTGNDAQRRKAIYLAKKIARNHPPAFALLLKIANGAVLPDRYYALNALISLKSKHRKFISTLVHIVKAKILESKSKGKPHYARVERGRYRIDNEQISHALVQERAVQTLFRYRVKEKSLIPYLLKALKNPKVKYKQKYIWLLASMSDLATKSILQAYVQKKISLEDLSAIFSCRWDETVRVIASAFQDNSSSVREAAILLLSKLYPHLRRRNNYLSATDIRNFTPILGGILAAKSQKKHFKRDAIVALGVLGEVVRREKEALKRTGYFALDNTEEKILRFLRPFALNNKEEGLQILSIESLRGLEKHAIPVLKKVLLQKSRTVRVKAIWGLGQAGAAALPLIVKQLHSKETQIQKAAIGAIGTIAGKSALRYEKELVSILKGPEKSLYSALVYTLGKFEKLSPDTLRLLYKMAKARDWRVRIAVGSTLGLTAPLTLHSTIKALKRLLRDTQWQVRYHTLQALFKRKVVSKVVYPFLFRLFQDKHILIRGTLVREMSKLNDAVLLLNLNKFLSSSNALKRDTAIRILGGMKARARASASLLIRMYPLQDTPQKLSVLRALRQIPLHFKGELQQLYTRILTSKNTSLLKASLEALAQFKGKPVSLIPKMASYLRKKGDKQKALKEAAFQVLVSMREKADTLWSKWMMGKRLDLRMFAIRGIAENIKAVESYKTPLQRINTREFYKQLKSKNIKVRVHTLKAMRGFRIDRHNRVLLEMLQQNLRHKNIRVRESAVLALSSLRVYPSTPYSIHLSLYNTLKSDSSSRVRVACAKGFGLLAKDSLEILVILLEGVKDRDSSVRKATLDTFAASKLRKLF